MDLQQPLTWWSPHPGVSLAIWFVILALTMYLGRFAAHRAISQSAAAVRSIMRLAGRSLMILENRVNKRNTEVLITTGTTALGRSIEQEFQRVSASVERDLSSYPAVHRRVTDAIKRLEDDYKSAAETAPPPPAWLEVVTAIGNVPRHGDSRVDQVLTEVYELVERAHKETLAEFNKSSVKKLGVLRRMVPIWRDVGASLGSVKSNIDSLKERAMFIDEKMSEYELLRRGNPAALRRMLSSSFTDFIASTLVLVIAIFGAIVNFQLIALPMSEMVGGTTYLGTLRMADVAALVIIMIETTMGLFLLESLRVTRLFPAIHSLDDRLRRKLLTITLIILVVFAAIESSLAYMRDVLALDREALTQSLAGVQQVTAEFRWIPSVGQMVLGFVLPFALAFVAIPLESFIHASRTVSGLLFAGLLRLLSFSVRTVGNAAAHTGRILVSAYDFVIFLPLWIEQQLAGRTRAARDTTAAVPQKRPALPATKGADL